MSPEQENATEGDAGPVPDEAGPVDEGSQDNQQNDPRILTSGEQAQGRAALGEGRIDEELAKLQQADQTGTSGSNEGPAVQTASRADAALSPLERVEHCIAHVVHLIGHEIAERDKAALAEIHQLLLKLKIVRDAPAPQA